MSVLNKAYFRNERAAFAHLEKIVWPDGPVCPHCKTPNKAGRLKGSSHRPGLWKCYAKGCRRQFTVRVGTVFESSHVPLHKWLQCAHLMAASKKGISAHQLHRILGVTYKTAWFMAHRLREAMRDGSPTPLGGEGKVIEADDTFTGNAKEARQRKIFINGKGWVRRGGGKDVRWTVLSLVERGGKARSVHVKGLTANVARDVIVRSADRKSRLHTDEAKAFRPVGREFASHERVNHSRHEYVRGDVTTNTIESFFALFKRGMRGTYQHCGEQHLQRYLTEFDFRHNHRIALGIDDEQRAEEALRGIVGKRLTYRRPDTGAHA